jgi:hypothetical protein
MLATTCHCGAVTVEIPRPPETVTNCNCSICRRYGALWAFYPADEVKVTAAAGGLDGYSWGDKDLRFVRCANCGCILHWEAVAHGPQERRGVNVRNFDPEQIGDVKIRRLDGASTWEYLED